MTETTKSIDSDSNLLGRLGSLEVRLAADDVEIAKAQRLRHEVFCGSISPEKDPGLIDHDRFDPFCDHLIVVETAGTRERIVATYRLMGPEQANRAGGYYSAGEFEVEQLVTAHGTLRFLELGRSCVLPQYRDKRTVELLWHGSWAYVCRYGFDVMFGCASFPGTQLGVHREALAFLAASAAPDDGWKVSGRGDVITTSELEPGGSFEGSRARRAVRSLPPLIKGYLRLGAMFSEHAVVDREFDTIDVLVLLPVSRLNPRYVNYYGANAERHDRRQETIVG